VGAGRSKQANGGREKVRRKIGFIFKSATTISERIMNKRRRRKKSEKKESE